jgi:hypothetical protein
MGHPKIHDFPPYMTTDGDRGGYIVRNPITRHRKRVRSEAAARKEALGLAITVAAERQKKKDEISHPTLGRVVAAYVENQMPYMPWSPGTRRNYLYKFKKIDRDLGTVVIEKAGVVSLTDYLAAFCKTADIFNKWRHAFVLLLDYAISRDLTRSNEAAKVLERSTSKKLAANKKRRLALDMVGFKAIHGQAEPWLQLAMEISLVTLQARNEICSMQHEHFREGHLFIVRAKVSGESDMAFIKLALNSDIVDLQSRARRLDNIVSPYLVHRKPLRRTRISRDAPRHWTYVLPHYLSQSFKEARNKAGLWGHLPAHARPSFHEIRGLGSRLSMKAGASRADIQALMTHSTPRTTAIYLDGGLHALTDSDYRPVTTKLSLTDALKLV